MYFVFVCVCKFKKNRFKVTTLHKSESMTLNISENEWLLSLNKETLIARKFPLYHAVLH